MPLPSRLILITRSQSEAPAAETALLEALQGGARWLLWRDKGAAPRTSMAGFLRAQRLCEAFGAQLYINGRADLARATHAAGLHLPEAELPAEAARPIVGHHLPLGVSVHSREGAIQAQLEGADYLIFGPVFPTASHPGSPAMGMEALADVVEAVRLPVFAIGGIGAAQATDCLIAGATGVAVISSVWDAPSIGGAVRELLDALGERAATSQHDHRLPAHLQGSLRL